MEKQKNPNYIKAGKLTLFQRLAMLLFGVGSFYLLVRTLDQGVYGTWMLFFSLASLIVISREGFLKKPLIKYLNELEGVDRKKLQAASLHINVIFSLISSTILIVLSSFLTRVWDAPGLQYLVYIYFFTNLISALFSHCNNLLEARFRFMGPMVGHVVKSASFFGFIAIFYFTKTPMNIWHVGFCDLGSTTIATMVMLAFSRKLIGFKFYASRERMGKLFAYGKYTLGTNISGTILRNTDIWMIGWFISPAAVAVYNVAIRIANLFEVPTMAMASILFPQAVKKIEREGEPAFKELYEKSVTVILLVVAPMVAIVVFFSNEIVFLLAGAQYAEAGWILKITMLYGLLIPFSKQMSLLLDALGKAKTAMFFVLRNAAINIVLNALYIPYFGAIGAAYATLNTMVIVLIINQIYLRRKFNVSLWNLVYYSKYFLGRAKRMALSRI